MAVVVDGWRVIRIELSRLCAQLGEWFVVSMKIKKNIGFTRV